MIGNGYNEYGQLSIENQKQVVLSPTLIMKDIEIKDIFCGAHHNLILKNNGELFGMGYNSNGNIFIFLFLLTKQTKINKQNKIKIIGKWNWNRMWI